MKDNKNHIDQLPKDNIFKVPERYFDELPNRIQEQITSPRKESFFINIQMQWIGSLTAAVIFIFIGVTFLSQPNESQADLLADVTADDIIEYLEYEDISTLEIASLIDIESMLDDEPIEYLQLTGDEILDEDLELIYSEIDFSTDIM